MTAELLREAAAAARAEWDNALDRKHYPEASRIHCAVADLLDCAADEWIVQPRDTGDRLFAVARAYLAAAPVDGSPDHGGNDA